MKEQEEKEEEEEEVEKKGHGSKIIHLIGTIENHTLLQKVYDFGTILLFSSLSTRRTTYSPIKSARKVSTMHTKIVLDYDSRRVEKKEGA